MILIKLFKENISMDKHTQLYNSSNWVLCPICQNKTRLKIREDTELINFPLFCPKCKQEHIINVTQFNIEVIIEPDAQTQSR